MRRHHPAPRSDVAISAETYHQLLAATFKSDFEKEDWEIEAEAIDEWTRRHNPDALSGPATTGYQWKRLFLPSGTLLRTVFKAKNHHCMVEGDTIIFDKQAVSPSSFINAVGGIRRNAWKCTWILFPDTSQWALADSLRTSQRPRRTPERASFSAQKAANRPVDSTPVTGASGTISRPAQPAHVAPPVPAALPPQHALHADVPGPNRRDQRRPGRQGPAPEASPPGFVYGTNRRINEGDQAFLRQELLPLLIRMCRITGIGL